jgi:type VI secretion system secreted protein VgrG
MSDLITISSSVLPDSTRVLGFRGVEALSRPYELEIFLSLEGAEGDELDLADGIGAKARLVIDRHDDKLPPFIFAGILASVDLLHAAEGRSLVRVLLVPRLWQLRLSMHSRVFTKMPWPDVLKAILEENSIVDGDYELRLGSYEAEEHICQYRESDLDFISRWLEREGIWYYFVHSDEGEKVVFCDDKNYEQDLLGLPVRYFPQLGQDYSAGPSFRSFTCRHQSLPATIKLKDYDYARPNLNVAGSAQVSPIGTGEVSLYGERFFSPNAGNRLAKMRAEEMRARSVVYQGVGTRSHMRPGHTFELEDHPRSPFNTKYLTTEVRHHGNQHAGATHFRKVLDLEHDDVYIAEVSAISADAQFRPEHRAAWPRIYGYENGTVCGAADSEYAQIDDQGRYNVKFKFDESALKNGNASTYVRMMQPHGGGVEGFHFPLRKGTEVVFSFLGGDPDRPVISGVVPNALTPSPVTSGNHTKNVIQTGGRNRLELEDKSGQQRITMSTPHTNSYLRMGAANDGHTMILHTDGPTHMDAGGDMDVEIGYHSGAGHKNEKVKGPVEETYENTKLEHVTLAVTENFDNTLTTTVGQMHKHKVASGGQQIGIAGGMGTHVNGGVTFKIGSGAEPAATETAGFKAAVTGGDVDITTDLKTNIIGAGDIKIDSTGGKMDVHAKGAIDITAVGPLTMNGAKETINILGESFKVVNSSKSELTYGIVKTIDFSGNLKFAASATASITLAASLEAKAGIFVSASFAGTFSFNGGWKAEFTSVTDLRATPMKIQNATAGFCFNSTGTFMINTPTLVFTGGAFMSRAAIQMIN